MQDIIIDIETLSTKRKAVIPSLCARVCNVFTGESARMLHIALDVQQQIDDGYIVDASTLAFWMKQGDEARRYMTTILERKVDVVHRDIAMQQLTDFIKSVPNAQVWGNGISFDLGMLDDDLRAISDDGQLPWQFRNERDVRTVVDMCRRLTGKHPKHRMKAAPSGAVVHNPIWDTLYELNLIHNAFNMMKPAGLDIPKAEAGLFHKINNSVSLTVDSKLLTDGFVLPAPLHTILGVITVRFNFPISETAATRFINIMNTGGKYNYIRVGQLAELNIGLSSNGDINLPPTPWLSNDVVFDFKRAASQVKVYYGPPRSGLSFGSLPPNPKVIFIEGLPDNLISQLNAGSQYHYVRRPAHSNYDVMVVRYGAGYEVQVRADAQFNTEMVNADIVRVLKP